MADGFRLEMAPDDHVDWACEELIRRVFGFEGSLITDESTLDDFEGLPEDAFPGHEEIRLTDVPLDDLSSYASEYESAFSAPENIFVWYPPLTKEEEEAAWEHQRQRALEQVAAVFGPAIFDYPDEELYVWKVARFLVHRGYLRRD